MEKPPQEELLQNSQFKEAILKFAELEGVMIEEIKNLLRDYMEVDGDEVLSLIEVTEGPDLVIAYGLSTSLKELLDEMIREGTLFPEDARGVSRSSGTQKSGIEIDVPLRTM